MAYHVREIYEMLDTMQPKFFYTGMNISHQLENLMSAALFCSNLTIFILKGETKFAF